MPPSVRHLTPADLAYRLRLIKDGATEDDIRRAEQKLAEWRTQGRGPAYIRGESAGRKAMIRYRLTDVEAWEESRLVAAREPA